MCIPPIKISINAPQVGAFLWNPLKNLFQFFIGDGAFFGLVEYGSKVNGFMCHLNISNDPCPTRFAFPFGSNGQTNFIKAIAECGSLFWFIGEFFDKHGQVSFKRRVFFSKSFSLLVKKRYGGKTITHPEALLRDGL